MFAAGCKAVGFIYPDSKKNVASVLRIALVRAPCLGLGGRRTAVEYSNGAESGRTLADSEGREI